MEDSKTIKQGAIFFIGIGAFVFIFRSTRQQFFINLAAMIKACLIVNEYECGKHFGLL